MNKMVDLRYKDVGERKRAKYEYPKRIKLEERVRNIIEARNRHELTEFEASFIMVSFIQNNYRRRKRG